MELDYRTDVRDDDALRASFNALTRRVFGFDFAGWHAAGWWSPARTGYTPHALAQGREVVANVSATPITFRVAGQTLRALQLGTVMTDPAWRGQGLQRRLMESVLSEAAGRYDMIYLYANESVLEFYPRFGFAPETEYGFSCALPAGDGAAAPADMSDPAACEKLLRLYAWGNPFSAAAMTGETGLLMFYCAEVLGDCVRFIDELDAAAVAEYDGDTLLLHDVFCPAGTRLNDVLRALAKPGVSRVSLGFTPVDPAGMDCAPLAGDDGGLFVMKGLADPFAERKMRLPTLSHT